MKSQTIPFLPGHVFSDPYKTEYRKDQIFSFRTKTCLEKPRLLEPVDSYTLSSLRKNLTIKTTPESTMTLPSISGDKPSKSFRVVETNPSFPLTLPQWLKFDKKVLSFEGHFNEHVTESAYENYRIRPCTLLYYLEDDTFQIKEHKQENSGIPQGEFLKRHRAINQDSPSGDFLTWKDINIGMTIFIYGKRFKICSCDEFTQKFFEEKGIKLNPFEKIPEIDYGDKFKNVDYEKMKKTIAEIKEYTEVGLKGGHPNKRLKQFLDNDRKVLSFDISWYDNVYDKEEKKYKLNYYLADGQIEVCEIRVNNSGKDPFPRLLKKSKLPKKPHMGYCPGLDLPEDEYYLPKDFVLGNYVVIYNRKCRIIGCDDFTKKWFKEK